MANSTFEEEIQRSGRLVYTNVGRSMMPLIIIGVENSDCHKAIRAIYKEFSA